MSAMRRKARRDARPKRSRRPRAATGFVSAWRPAGIAAIRPTACRALRPLPPGVRACAMRGCGIARYRRAIKRLTASMASCFEWMSIFA